MSESCTCDDVGECDYCLVLEKNKRLERENEKLKIENYQEKHQDECECDMHSDTCDVCLQIHRMKRYGSDIHDARCVCNDCTHGPYGYPRSDY